MASNYVVTYNIKVNSKSAITAVEAFQKATAGLTMAAENVEAFNKALTSVATTFTTLAQKKHVLSFNTDSAKRKLDTIITKLERIDELAAKNRVINIGGNAATNTQQQNTGGSSGSTVVTGGGTSSNSSKGASGSSNPKKSGSKPSKTSPSPKIPPSPQNPWKAALNYWDKHTSKNIGYRMFGPSMLDSGGIGIVNMAKGMGIAYGIMGLGTLMSNTIHDATEYNNLMQTTRNILESHDAMPGFDSRFKSMERVVRGVGVNTKFTAPQVADAAKFLAMAGLNVGEINQSISPIADIALVGDTDLGETADVVTNIMTGYGIKASNMRHAADIMTQTFTMSNVTLMEIAESYKYAASLLSAGGISFEEATAGLGVLGDAGIKGSQAGTTFRTIMNNLVNPTKKQKRAWKRLGINRFDENGNLRNLTDIFGDLSKANMNLADFYQMFHKTAAQGAVALTKHVDKWNEIVEENFLSEGLVNKLAEEKKNTIQGLWAQLTSAFTEAGLRAFEDLEIPIRNFLREVIDQFKSGELQAHLTQLGTSLLGIIKYVKGFTEQIMLWYSGFHNLIDGLLKLQLKLVPLLILCRMIRAGWTALTGTVIGVTRALRGLKNAIVGFAMASTSERIYKLSMRIWLFVDSLKALKAATMWKWAGIGAAMAIIVAACTWFYSYVKSVDKATEATSRFIDNTSSINGISLSEYATNTDKNLLIIQNRQLKVNQALGEHVRLLRERFKLEDQHKKEEKLKDSDKATEWNNWVKAANANLTFPIMKNMADRYNFIKPFLDKKLVTVGRDENSNKYYQFLDNKYYNNESDWEQLVSHLYLYRMGQDMSEKSPTKNLLNMYDRAFVNVQSSQEIEDIRERILGTKVASGLYLKWNSEIYSKYSNDPNSPYFWKIDQISNASLSDLEKTGDFINGQYTQLLARYDERSNSPFAQNLRILEKMLDLYQKGQDIGEDMMKQYLVNAGIFYLDEKRYGKFGSKDWLKNIGYINGEWSKGEYILNNKKGKYSAEEASTLFHQTYQDMLSVIQSIPPILRSAFGSLVQSPYWSIDTPKRKPTYSMKPVTLGHEIWDPVWGANGATVWQLRNSNTQMSDSEFNQKVDAYYNNGKKGGGRTGVSNVSSEGYKSNYSRNSVAPKQVIVKIGNLMNVESIDMENPNVAAVVDEFKAKFAEVMLAAAQDVVDTANIA